MFGLDAKKTKKTSAQWKDVISTSTIKTNYDCFASGLLDKLGAKDSISLWNSRWIGEAPLKNLFQICLEFVENLWERFVRWVIGTVAGFGIFM